MTKPIKTKRGLWQVRTTDEQGKRRKRSFPRYEDAIYAANVERARVTEVKRGLRSPLPPDRTFRELADYWRANRVPLKRSGFHDESILRCHLLPAFGQMNLKDIGVAEVDRFICDRLHLDKKTIANHVTLLGTMLRLAVDLGWLTKAPKLRKPKVRLFSKDFRYLRTQDEIDRFLRAAAKEGPLAFTLYATALYTGMRAGELAGLTWPKVDFDRRLITVDHSFDGPTKADDVRYVPILDALLPILRRWCLLSTGALVFMNRDGGMLGKAGRMFQEVFKRVLDDAGFAKTTTGARVRRYIRFHDLRHTFASWWVAKGGDIFKLQKILGHKSVQMTMRYAHLAPEAYAEDHARLPGPPPLQGGVVLPLPHRDRRRASGPK